VINNNRKKLFVVAGLLSVLIILFFVVFIQNNSGKRVGIDNFNEKIKNLSSESKDSIEGMLYQTVKINNNDPDKIKSVKIREGSETQNYNSDLKLYTGSFIVDLESIKKSFRINYTEVKSDDKSMVGGYPFRVTCLTKEELIFGEFDCKTIYNNTEVSGKDSILNKLPYTTLDYSVDGKFLGDKLVIIVDFTLSEADTRSGVDAVISKYKQEISDWIKSNGFNPSDYDYQYNY